MVVFFSKGRRGRRNYKSPSQGIYTSPGSWEQRILKLADQRSKPVSLPTHRLLNFVILKSASEFLLLFLFVGAAGVRSAPG